MFNSNRVCIGWVLFVIGIFAHGDHPKVLHLTLHKGCHREVMWLGEQLGLDLTSIFIQDKPPCWLDDETVGNAIYNVTAERARKTWLKHKNFFESFDLIITSDTAPLSRIFLQNGWKKPLIIWICNRFDYADKATAGNTFPDAAYYALMRDALTMPNVRIVGYTPYEITYAHSRNVMVPHMVIKPCAAVIKDASFASSIPSEINKSETFFIPAYHNDRIFNLEGECKRIGIRAYCGRYNGPEDLKDFKGVIHFPYAWSNLALFENIQHGITYYLPSKKFFCELTNSGRYFSSGMSLQTISLSEWYAPEHADFFVYFDSWQDLKNKISQETPLIREIRQHKIKMLAEKHRAKTIQQWKSLIHSLEINI